MFVPIQFVVQHHPKVGHAVFRCDFNTIHGQFFDLMYFFIMEIIFPSKENSCGFVHRESEPILGTPFNSLL